MQQRLRRRITYMPRAKLLALIQRRAEFSVLLCGAQNSRVFANICMQSRRLGSIGIVRINY